MVDYINKIFGIDNTISVPIIVSLIVFITGAIGQLLYKSIIEYRLRKDNRDLFKNLISEIIRKCSRNSINIHKLLSFINMETEDNYVFITTPITYLELIYKQDYLRISNAYLRLFRFKHKRKIGKKAFHRIWSILETLKDNEKNIKTDFKLFITNLNRRKELFSNYIKEIKTLNDKLYQPYINKKVQKSDLLANREFQYIYERNKITVNWSKYCKDNNCTELSFCENLINPLIELNNRYQDLEITIEIGKILLNARHQFEEIKILYDSNYKLFYIYYRNYRSSYKILKRCIEIIK